MHTDRYDSQLSLVIIKSYSNQIPSSHYIICRQKVHFWAHSIHIFLHCKRNLGSEVEKEGEVAGPHHQEGVVPDPPAFSQSGLGGARAPVRGNPPGHPPSSPGEPSRGRRCPDPGINSFFAFFQIKSCI